MGVKIKDVIEYLTWIEIRKACNHYRSAKDKVKSKAYMIVSDHYGDRSTARSGVRLMNHIDEGLVILDKLGASDIVKDAYCLHPMLQSDEDFNKNITHGFYGVPSESIILAVEYRRVANSYLSTGNIEDFVGFTNDDIRLMLCADKIQNEKDFATYHEGTHPRSKELREYFDNWLHKLLLIATEEVETETKNMSNKSNWEKYFKLPLSYDGFNFVWDANDSLALMFDYDSDEELRHKVVDILNGDSKETIEGLENEEIDFDLNGKPFFCVRGWGKLTGAGGHNLTVEEATAIQDGFVDYINAKLKGEKEREERV